MNQLELGKFFRALNTEKHMLLFMAQMVLSLRISEACILNREQINFERQTASVFEPKTGAIIEKRIPPTLFARLMRWMQLHKREIAAHGGYIFFPDVECAHKKAKEGCLSPDHARNIFHQAIVKAGLDHIYGRSRDGRKLYVFGTHSLRRTGITRMDGALRGDRTRLKLYSGHEDTASLETYVQENEKERIFKIVDEVFG